MRGDKGSWLNLMGFKTAFIELTGHSLVGSGY